MAILPPVVLGDGDHGREHQHRDGDHPEVARLRADDIFEHETQDADRNGSDDHVPAQPVVDIVPVGPYEQTAEPGLHDARDIAGEIHHHRGFSAELGHRGKGRAGVPVKEHPGHDRQMSRRGDGQEFGQSLD